MLGNATAPVPYAISNGKTKATEDQIEGKESKIIDFEKREYCACHILLLTMLICFGSK